MRYGVFSDVHSNLEALEVVLSALVKEGVDQLLCAGDLVGYGPDPDQCLALLRTHKVQLVCGNHDLAVADGMDLNWFNQAAKEAVLWTRSRLPPSERDALKALPFVWENGEGTLVHGSLHEPDRFHYVLDAATASRSLDLQKTIVTFIGHTHVPGVFVQEGSRIDFTRQELLTIDPARRYLVNVGSVGQPRDGDPKACTCVYDTETQTLQTRRIPYPIEAVQAKMRKVGLPEFLAERLAFGF